ncbi:DUF6332 family protein, partial [Streptomyces olivaceus]
MTFSRAGAATPHRRPADGAVPRWEKDAMTVEIVFALVTAAVLAGLVFA